MTTSKKISLLALTDNELDKKVKIQGTKYDRKRKINDELIKQMNKLSKKMSYSQIANKLGVSYFLVRYNMDPLYRKHQIDLRSGLHTGKDHITKTNRVAYKRQLIVENKVSA